VSLAFVLDASIALAWCFRDEETTVTRQLFSQMQENAVLVPSLWFIEMTNILSNGERKGRTTAAEVETFITVLSSFDIEIDSDGPNRAFSQVLPLCRAHQLTSYDAVYLELALRRHLPLATLDDQLRKAAKKLDVKLLGL